MTNTYDTTMYPLGSTEVKVLFNNASNLDDAVNGESNTWADRFNVTRQSWRGIENAFNAFLINSGYEFLGDYDDPGEITFTRANQVMSKSGEYWRPAASLSLPYTTVNNWVVDQPKFVSIGDASLRTALADPSDVSNGDARIAVRKIAAGLTAINRTQHGLNEESVSLNDFNDIPDAIAWAMSSTGRRCIILPGGELDMSGKQFLLPPTPVEPTSPLYFKTAGGTKIVKEDGGYLFDVDGAFFYDLIVEGLQFEGIQGAGCILFNTDKIIRLIAERNHSKYIDHYMKGDSYCQTVRMYNNIQRYGQSFCTHLYGYDVGLIGNIIEHGADGIRFTRSSADYALLNSVVQNNVIEGMSGVGLQTGACASVMVSGNYQELNGFYTDFGASAIPHAGLRHHSNWYFMDAAQKLAGMFPVTTGNHVVAFSSGGNFSNGNMYDNTANTSTMMSLEGDYYLGQLYKGHTALNDPARNPLNGAHFFEGHREAWCFNKQVTFVDAVTGAWGHSSAATQVVIGTQLVHPETMHGPDNPQTTPGTYGNRAWAKGSRIINTNPVMQGSVPDRYYVDGWTCIQSSSVISGDPGTWIETIAKSLA